MIYPARPISGGRLEYAPRKIGQWRNEPKLNGWRCMVTKNQCFNRFGKPLSIQSDFADALDKLKHLSLNHDIDAEGLNNRHSIAKGTLVILDYISHRESYLQRRAMLE